MSFSAIAYLARNLKPPHGTVGVPAGRTGPELPPRGNVSKPRAKGKAKAKGAPKAAPKAKASAKAKAKAKGKAKKNQNAGDAAQVPEPTE